MCADVVSSVSVDMSESTLAYAHAKAVELGMGVSDYLELSVRVSNALPSSLLFCLSSGVPVHFSAAALVGDDE